MFKFTTNFDKSAFYEGVRDGIPIGLGYFVVAFTLGIAAKSAGLTPFQGFITSFLNNASAGEYAAFTVIAADASYFEMALITLVTNARYLLMSTVLSQKFSRETSFFHRILVGFDITDEIFGITVSRKGHINPFYNYGAMLPALPGWSIGTALGIIVGNILPLSVESALSVALYGMFLAVIIPQAKKENVIALVIFISFLLSLISSIIFEDISPGSRIIILTILISGIAAFIYPIDKNGID